MHRTANTTDRWSTPSHDGGAATLQRIAHVLGVDTTALLGPPGGIGHRGGSPRVSAIREVPIAVASVTVTSPSPGTVLEIRTATSPFPRLADTTTLVGTATLHDGSTQIPLRAGPPARHQQVMPGSGG
jgi:hypothetical protein